MEGGKAMKGLTSMDLATIERIEGLLAKATPGPWEAVPPSEHHGWYIEDGLGRTVADLYYLNSKTEAVVRHDPHGLGKDAANAVLIAALIEHAPALLAAARAGMEEKTP